MVANAGANLPGNERILLRDVVADEQHRGRVVDVRHRRERIFRVRPESGGEAGVIGRAVMVDVVGAERDAREAVQQVVFFVGGVIRSDHGDRGRAVQGVSLPDAPRDFFESVFPARRFKRAVAADERLADALGIRGEIEAEASLGAEELAVRAGVIAIVGAQNFVVANAERGLAAIRAVGAGLADVGHFPRARLVAIGAAGERADGADIDAHAALFAGELARLIREDDGVHAARADAESFYVHALIAHAHAAEAENAARGVVIDERRPFFFGSVQLFLDEARFVEAVAEGHVLEFALAAFVADGAIERMIREEELDHVLARFVDLVGGGLHHHAVGCDERAGGLQLGHFFDFDEAHAASGLQREAGVVAERRDFDALRFCRFDHKRAGVGGDWLAVDCEGDLFLFRHSLFPE